MRLISTNAAETAQAGASVATRLVPGDAVLVSGDLGAGKTTFIRGACRALGVDEPVTSPTFMIGQVYGASRPDGTAIEVAHLDLYRLSTLSGEDPALLDDYLTPDRIAFVEWPGRALDSIQRIAARVSIEHLGGDRRVIQVS